jgi:hypothetical protein
MSSPDILVLGFFLLASNLTLCALFAPARQGSGGAHHVMRLWKLLGLAMLNIASWAIVLEQAGATKGFSESFVRTASVFALMGGYYDGAVMPEPWNVFAPLIALNGLLFIPCALLPIFLPSVAEAPPAVGAPAADSSSATPTLAATPAAPAPVETAARQKNSEASVEASGSAPVEKPGVASVEKPAPAQRPATPSPAVVPAPAAAPALNPAASPLMATLEDLPEPSLSEPAADPNQLGVYRASVPKGPALSPAEAEYAAQMKPLGPTPPPIRFGRPL